MKNRSLARFVVFALIQVVLCVLAFVFAAGISSAEPEFQTDGSIYVDGTDFTPLAQLGGEILNGALSLLALGASFLVTAVISAVLLVPFRFISVRKDSILTRIEARGTLIVILVCTAVSLISAAIFGRAGCMVAWPTTIPPLCPWPAPLPPPKTALATSYIPPSMTKTTGCLGFGISRITPS